MGRKGKHNKKEDGQQQQSGSGQGSGQQGRRDQGSGSQGGRGQGSGQQDRRDQGSGSQGGRGQESGQQDRRDQGSGQQDRRDQGSGQQGKRDQGSGQQGRRDQGSGSQGGRGQGSGQQDRRDQGYGQQGGRDQGSGQQDRRDQGSGQQDRRDQGSDQQGVWSVPRARRGESFQQQGRGQQQLGHDQQPQGRGQQPQGRGQEQQGRGQQQQGRGQRQPGRGQRQPGRGQRQPGRGQRQPGRDQQQQEVSQQLQKPQSSQRQEAHAQQDVAASVSEDMSKMVIASGSKLPQKVYENFASKGSLVPQVTKAMLEQIPVRTDLWRERAKGIPVPVFANMLHMDISSCVPNIIHYDVSFDNKTPKKSYRTIIKKIFTETIKNAIPAFDGKKNLYAARNLFNENEKTFQLDYTNLENRERPTTVTIKKVNTINMAWMNKVEAGYWRNEPSDMTSITALDIIIKAAALSNGVVPYARSFFPLVQPYKKMLCLGAELWIGSFTSAIIGWKPYLNVDVSHTGFQSEMNVADYINEWYNERKTNYEYRNKTPEDFKKMLGRYLRGLKVRYQIPGKEDTKRIYTMEALGTTPDILTFDLNKDKVNLPKEIITVYEHYKRKGYYIKKSDLPLVQVRPQSKEIFIPAELCVIMPGQPLNYTLIDKQVREVTRIASTDTDTRKRKIMNGVNAVRYNQNATLRHFGITINTTFEEVEARVLNAPRLQYNQSEVSVFKGVWSSKSFLNGSLLEDNKWALLSMDDHVRSADLISFAERLIYTGKQCGMKIGKAINPPETRGNPWSDFDLERTLNKLKNNGTRFVLVAISQHNHIYERVKKIAELKVGILTQCIKANTLLNKNNHSTLQNILLKVNAKLNGTNHTIVDRIRPKCLRPYTMMIGADVTHPDPGIEDKPSIAAVAASQDQNDFFKYNIDIRLQERRAEIISDLKNIVKRQIQIYNLKTGKLPDMIIFFRDGVSEGQFTQVMEHEVKEVKKACQEIEPKYNPPLTFIVVQKRHHTRFFPKNYNSETKNNNVSAGTIVDTKITHPTHIDFYLVSHASIQGTARPTKYRCLCNDSNISEDDLEELTYFMCHMFTRCNRSVSYPAPTYYAHLGAFRARAWMYDVKTTGTDLSRVQQNLTDRVSDVNPMFFV